MKTAFAIFIVFFLLSAGCATSTKKQIPSESVPIEFNGLYLRLFDNQPVTWLTVKVTNDSDKVIDSATVSVLDVTNKVNLYGEDHGYRIGGFSASPEKNQPQDLATLAPAESGYISVNIGARQGPTLRFTVILTTADGMLAGNELDIDISDKERVDQTGR